MKAVCRAVRCGYMMPSLREKADSFIILAKKLHLLDVSALSVCFDVN